MRVVFLEEVPGTAKIGDIKDVKAGFARNYLLPRKLAAPASAALIKSAEARAVREARLEEARDAEALGTAGKLDGAAYTISAKAGSTGKLFGSVGTADVAARVGETLGGEFDRHNVMLADPIKELGDYPVVVKLTRNVTATVTVSVVGEDGTTAADIRARKAGTSATAVAQEGGAADAADDESDAADGEPDAADEETDEAEGEAGEA